MPVTITYTGAVPTIDADEDVWGDKLNNDALTPIKADLDALASQGNATETASSGALQRSGGTMTGDLVLASVGPSNVRSAGYRGLPVVSLDADKTFALTDAGLMNRLTGATPRTWTIPPNGTIAFPVGTAIVIRNAASANLTLARGAGVQLRLVGALPDANRTVVPQGSATLIQEDVNIWYVSGVGVS